MGHGTLIVGGGHDALVSIALAGDLRLMSAGSQFSQQFKFQAVTNDCYWADNTAFEILYGDQGESMLLDVEDLLTMLTSIVEFDQWIDRQMNPARAYMRMGGR